MINLLVIIELTILAANLTISNYLLVSLLMLGPEEADDFDEDDDEEEEDGPGNQEHNDSTSDVITF